MAAHRLTVAFAAMIFCSALAAEAARPLFLAAPLLTTRRALLGAHIGGRGGGYALARQPNDTAIATAAALGAKPMPSIAADAALPPRFAFDAGDYGLDAGRFFRGGGVRGAPQWGTNMWGANGYTYWPSGGTTGGGYSGVTGAPRSLVIGLPV